MTKREWFIKIVLLKEGPYSIEELRADVRFNPDSLVWKEGFKDWLPAREVPELAVLFQDSEDLHSLGEPSAEVSNEEGVLVLDRQGPVIWWWLIIIIILVFLALWPMYR